MNETRLAKTIKKFNKRKITELKNNTESKEFAFAALDDVHWYFQFVIQDGLYKGQIHIVETKLIYGQDPDIYMYPIHAPMCRFITPIWHPNVSDKGTICLDVLKDNWSPYMFTHTIISALKMLLLNPEPSSPQNISASRMMKEEPDKVPLTIKELLN